LTPGLFIFTDGLNESQAGPNGGLAKAKAKAKATFRAAWEAQK
jgi:hypothetical protein